MPLIDLKNATGANNSNKSSSSGSQASTNTSTPKTTSSYSPSQAKQKSVNNTINSWNANQAAAAQQPAQQTAQKPQKTYKFNGQSYNSYEEAKKAQTAYQKVLDADWAASGYNKKRYEYLKSNNALLSQMSDFEKQYIQNKYYESGKASKYKKNATDSYLASQGLPSYKDLYKFRQQFGKYIGEGGIADVYTNLDMESLQHIKDTWKSNLQVGADGKLYTQKGKAIEYGDSYLDDELKYNDLPPSSMFNELFMKYQQDRQTAEQKQKEEAEAKAVEEQQKQATHDHIQDFYNEVYKKNEKGVDLDTAWLETLNTNKFSDLVGYAMEPTKMPDPDADEYKGEGGSAKLEKDTLAAIEANNKFKAAEFRISKDEFGKWSATHLREIRDSQKAQKLQELAAGALSAMRMPATTEENKKKQADAIDRYLKATGSTDTHEKFASYLNLVNLGVPATLVEKASTNGVASIREWNDKHNKGNLEKWSEIEMALQGVKKTDGDYSKNMAAYMKTQAVSLQSNYDKESAYNPQLYDNELSLSQNRSTSRNNAYTVSANGALYAAVNGKEYGQLDSSTTPTQLDMLRDFVGTGETIPLYLE